MSTFLNFVNLFNPKKTKTLNNKSLTYPGNERKLIYANFFPKMSNPKKRIVNK